MRAVLPVIVLGNAATAKTWSGAACVPTRSAAARDAARLNAATSGTIILPRSSSESSESLTRSKTTNATGLSKLGPVPMEQLGAVYQLLGGTEDVGIPLAQLWELWRSMELPIDEPAEQQRLQVVLASARVQPHEHATVSFEQLCVA